MERKIYTKYIFHFSCFFTSDKLGSIIEIPYARKFNNLKLLTIIFRKYLSSRSKVVDTQE